MTNGAKILFFGDFSMFKIIDRVGMSVELIPQIVGATNRFPTGQRGIYVWWRNGSKVLDAVGFRALTGRHKPDGRRDRGGRSALPSSQGGHMRYKAKQAFGVQFEGEFVTISAGEEVDTDTKAGAALVKQLGKDAVAEHFEDYVGTGQFARPDQPVEQATAEPGEKRTTKRTTRKS